MEDNLPLQSSKKVISLQAELEKELKELKTEIEDVDISQNAAGRGFSSVPLPQDPIFYKIQRKTAIKNALKVREAMQLTVKSDVMKTELVASMNDEYAPDNIGMILHQFFTDQVQCLAYCKQMHMSRWARICKDRTTTESLYPDYKKRLNHIIEEYQDAVHRAKRLAPSGKNAANIIKKEDLLIYIRWLICHLHSVKHVHSFLKVLEWLPSSRLDDILPSSNENKDSKNEPSKSQAIFRTLKRKLSTVKKTTSILKQSSPLQAQVNIPTAPALSTDFGSSLSSVLDISSISSACGGGLASNEVNLSIPYNNTNKESYSQLFDFLLACYGINMQSNELETRSDELDILHLVLRKFTNVHYKQEQLRSFPIYGTKKDIDDFHQNDEEYASTFKKSCNWLDFIQIRPRVDGMQQKSFTTLEKSHFIDELLRLQSQFLHVSDSKKILSCLKEHAKSLNGTVHLSSISVSTHKTNNDTSLLWHKIFDYSNRRKDMNQKETLSFETKISKDDIAAIDENELDLSAAVELLGLEDDDQKKHPLANNGTYLAFLVLRHLRIRDLQRTCLGILNYFRSIERTLTIIDGGLISKDGSFQVKRFQPDTGRLISGIGTHHHVHSTSADYRIEQNEFLDTAEVENHDDFYTFQDGRIHVQDQQGQYIIYDACLPDFTALEHQLLLIGSEFISKHLRTSKVKKKAFENSDSDLLRYGGPDVDRFGVLLDLWTNEAAFLENKRKVISYYMELYQHVFHPDEKRNIAQIVVDMIHKRPRFDFNESYFVGTYRSENHCLRLQLNLIETITNKQIDGQREHIQKVCRSPETEFGMPLNIKCSQNISLNQQRSALRYVYFLEFHPSLSLVCKVTDALRRILEELALIHKPNGPTALINLERRLYDVALEEYNKMQLPGHDYTVQLQRDVFSETFIEDPVLVCSFAQSVFSLFDEKRSRQSMKDGKSKLLEFWCKILQIITLRHRLIDSCHESSILSKIYREKAKYLGFDDCHLYLRAVSFEFAQRKSDAETRPISTEELMQNDSWVDRYTAVAYPLAVQELDEKHIGNFSLRTQDGLLQICQEGSVEKLKTALMCQISHKNLLAACVLKIENCIKLERKNINVSDNRSLKMKPDESRQDENTFSSSKTNTDQRRNLQGSFTSVQIEKSCIRNWMLNKFLDEKETKVSILNNVDEMMKLKRKMIQSFCLQLHGRTTQHCLISQIAEYIFCISETLDEFPMTRDNHFMFGTKPSEENKKVDNVKSEVSTFKRRPARVLSDDGKYLCNLWFLPHYREVLQMGKMLKDHETNASLKVTLRLISALHDICQYLCAHAKLGSSRARLGSKKLEFSCVTADWGGTEGIGAELREIQLQIDKLENPMNPYLVADYLEKRRDVMYLEFDVAVCQSARKTFLQTGNEKAYKSISDCMLFSIEELSNITRPSLYSSGLPLPLTHPQGSAIKSYPWRAYLSQFGPFPLMNKPFHKIGYNMQQCLAGLHDVDRYVVNGEILSLSLLLEDVLLFGPPEEAFPEINNEESEKQKENSEVERRSPDKRESQDLEMKKGIQSQKTSSNKLSVKDSPLEAIEFLRKFVLLYSRLEHLKEDWACRKFGVLRINTAKLFHNFLISYNNDVLQAVYRQIAVLKGQDDYYSSYFIAEDSEPLLPPDGVGEFEIKQRQLARLVESLECSMIHDVIRKISREHTLVIAEKSRDDPNLPTDLWKKASIKENIVLVRPHIVEDFLESLMNESHESRDDITFIKQHMDNCAKKLASDVLQREKLCFNSYSTFYENLLRQLNQSIYMKEQEIQQIKCKSQLANFEQNVEVDCLMAEKCRSLILEVTALRSKVSEMAQAISEQETDIKKRFKHEYNALVIELFNNAFAMKNRFEQFRSCLYEDVFDCLGEVRKLAVDSMKKLREKSGKADVEMHSLSQRLIRAEQLREAQWESKNLLNMILKLKAISHWNRTKNQANFQLKLSKLQEDVARTKQQRLEGSLLQTERETLLEQEISALRKALAQSERDCQTLRKKLLNEQTLKLQKSNSQMQETLSQKKIDLAKSANIDKLLRELEEKEEKLRHLAEMNDRETLASKRAKNDSKKALKLTVDQLFHERTLKLGAFERCEDLQKQVDEYEEHIEIIARPASSQSYHTACFPAVPGGRTSPQRSNLPARPHTLSSSRGYQLPKPSRTPHNQPLKNFSYKNDFDTNGGFSPSPGARSKSRAANARLRKKISETLLTDIDSLDVF